MRDFIALKCVTNSKKICMNSIVVAENYLNWLKQCKGK